MFDKAGIQKDILYSSLIQMGTKYLKNKKLKEEWREDNPTRNYCYVVSEFVYQYLSPIGSSVWCLDVEGDSEKHWFVKWEDGTIVDLSAEQFNRKIDYSKARRRFFQSPSPSKRTRILADLCGVKKLPYPNTDTNKIKSNITFDEIQKMSWEDLADYIDGLRKELLQLWDRDNKPPVIGKNESDIIKGFKQLKDYPIDNLFYEDKNYPNLMGLIKNFTKIGSSVNQFFPYMLKTKIGNRSLYDWFSDKNLSREFRRTIVRTLRMDGMYSFSKSLKISDGMTIDDLKNEGYDFWLETSDNSESESVKVLSDEIDDLLAKEVISEYHLRNILDDYRTVSQFNIRYYKKNQKVFPNLIQIFRLGFGQVPVNFPPLTARLIYEKFLPKNESESYTVYDMCSGWGGRLLGSLCSNLKIHYVGTDVNSNNFGCYERLGEFYNEHCDGSNTFDIFKDGSEVIADNKRFQKYKNQLDLAMTSPPYFHREVYSDDKEQSCLKFTNYNDWLKGYLQPTIRTCYEFLKPNRYMIINISDVKMGENEFIPLEQDTISFAVSNGFEFKGSMGMIMTRMIGLKPSEVKNNIYDSESRTYYKIEPILIFKKGS